MTAHRSYSALLRNDSALIFRQVSFSLAAFNRLKDYQRHLQRTEGRTLTNGEVLDRLILANPKP